MSHPYLRSMTGGEVLDGAFQLYRKHFPIFVLTALIGTLPMHMATGFAVLAGQGLQEPEAEAAWAAMVILLLLLGMPLYLMVWPALAHEIDCGVKGEEISMRAGWARALRAFFPLAGAWIMAGIVLSAAFFLIMIPFTLIAVTVAAGAASQSMLLAGIVGTVAGLLFLAVGLFAYTCLFAVLPAIVIERLGPIQGLLRSFSLAKGAWLRIAGVLLVALLITTLPGIGVVYFSGGFSNLFDPTAAATFSSTQYALQTFGNFITGARTPPFLIAVMVLLYYDRRVRLEALDLELASETLAAPEA